MKEVTLYLSRAEVLWILNSLKNAQRGAQSRIRQARSYDDPHLRRQAADAAQAEVIRATEVITNIENQFQPEKQEGV